MKNCMLTCIVRARLGDVVLSDTDYLLIDQVRNASIVWLKC